MELPVSVEPGQVLLTTEQWGCRVIVEKVVGNVSSDSRSASSQGCEFLSPSILID